MAAMARSDLKARHELRQIGDRWRNLDEGIDVLPTIQEIILPRLMSLYRRLQTRISRAL